MLSAALALILEGKYDQAFTWLNQRKHEGLQARSIDLLRARCFLGMNAKQNHVLAEQCLLEELGKYPDNEEALLLLSEIRQQQLPTNPDSFENDDDFNECYLKIQNYTLLSKPRLFNLWKMASEVLQQKPVFDFAEFGVFKGGTSVMLAFLIKKYRREKHIKMYCFDSFEGMPNSSKEDYISSSGIDASSSGWGKGTCFADKNVLLDLAEKLDVLNIIVPFKGLFAQTIPLFLSKVSSVSLVHIDCDWYSSTKIVLENIYPILSSGGFLQIDDYDYWQGTRTATDDYFSPLESSPKLCTANDGAVYCRRQ